MKTEWKWLGVLLVSASMIGCGGGGGGGDTPPPSGSNTSGNATPAFHLSGAVALVASSDVLVEATAAADTATTAGSGLFTYRIAGTDANSAGLASKAETTATGTNLLAIDSNGGASFAIESDYPVKAMYSAVNPDGTKAYIALDSGWYNWDGTNNDYSQFIALNNCAIYEVTLADDTFQCVAEGKYLQNYNESYYQTVSSNQKPVQFDRNGNVYFLATDFTVETMCGWYEGDVCVDEYSFFGETTWNPVLYKYDGDTVSNVTQDSDSVEFFSVLGSGEVVVKGWNQVTGDSELYAIQGSQRIPLNDSSWGVSFFTTDTHNTVIYGEWDQGDGIRLAMPAQGGGIYKASLSTSLFGKSTSSGYQSPDPRRVILADDGRMYGIFEGGYSTCVGDICTWNNTLSVYQVLPYDPIPKAELDMGDNYWWDYMGNTPFQISKGYLFYKETRPFEHLGASYGTADVIVMIKLDTRETKTLLMPSVPTDARYSIYNWRLAGTELYFSALDNAQNIVVTGKLDAAALLLAAEDAPQSDYLTITQSASALGAASEIQDISVLKPSKPEVDPGGEAIADFFTNADNLYSVSVDFSKYMNESSVLANLSFQDVTAVAADVQYLPIWVYKSLHLVPDLDGLANSTTLPLSANTDYQISISTAAQDYYGLSLASGAQEAFTTRPASGWYLGDSSASVAGLSSGQAAQFAGRASALVDDGIYRPDVYKIGTGLPADFRLEFSARNLGYELAQIVVLDDGVTNYWDALNSNIYLNSWTSLDYNNLSAVYEYRYLSDGSALIANGNWMRYRIDVYGSNYVLSTSEDGVTFVEVLSVNNLQARANGDTGLYFVMREPGHFDNIRISSLDFYGYYLSDIVAEQAMDSLPTELETPLTSGMVYEYYSW